MNTLTIVQLLPALETGGVERGTIEIAEALVEAGHRAIVVSAGGRMVPQLERIGAEHITLDIGAKRPWVLRQVKPLRKLLGQLGTQVVHARSRLPAWVAWRAISKMGDQRPAFVTTMHGMNSVSRYSQIMTQGDRVIAVSNACLDYWRSHYNRLDPSRVQVIHRGIDPVEFPFGFKPDEDWRDQFFEEYQLPRDTALLTLPGRLTDWKGQREFIQLIAKLTQQAPELPIVGLLVGGADATKQRYLQDLRNQAEQLGVVERLRFVGHRSDMREIYAISDLVFSMSKRPEAFGRTVTEALALGRPVIGWDHGGAGESLGSIYPVGKVPLGDQQALLATTLRLLKAPQAVPNEQPFLKSKMQAATLALYHQLARQRRDLSRSGLS